jgi:hypothetical protein
LETWLQEGLSALFVQLLIEYSLHPNFNRIDTLALASRQIRQKNPFAVPAIRLSTFALMTNGG